MTTGNFSVSCGYVVDGETPFLVTVESYNEKELQHFLSTPDAAVEHSRLDSETVRHSMSNFTERTRRLFMEKFQQFLNSVDNNRNGSSNEANESDAKRLKTSLDETRSDSSSISSKPFDWTAACERGQLSAINAFINHCPDFNKFCEDQRDTPLHHMRLKTSKEYNDFLANPLLLEKINALDFNYATPLHRALERQDILFVEELLFTDKVDLTLKDAKGNTAIDLLSYLCNRNNQWDELCKRIGVDPRQGTHYAQSTMTNLCQNGMLGVGEMRETLVVVAALLATLTFAAGFTLPGGFNNNTGEAILGKKASFIVFILADGYAMCCAMMVLFCLVATVAGDQVEALKRIRRTKYILIQSLYGTLLAFAAAVYTVVWDETLWAAIVIFVMCSLVAISANNPLICDLLDKFFPLTDMEEIHQSRTKKKEKQHHDRLSKRAPFAAANKTENTRSCNPLSDIV